MPAPIDRRTFLTRLAAAPLGVAALTGTHGILDRRGRGGGVDTAPTIGPLPSSRVDLPPPVVGLRTVGGDFVFDPPGLLLEAGATLVWLNMGDFHTTSAFHPDNSNLLGGEVPQRIPEGAESWHSGMLGLTAGSEFETTHTVPGIYDYFCQPHYGFGMVGRLVVGEPRDGPGSAPTDGLPEAARDNLPPANEIAGPRGRGWEWAARINGVLWLRSHDRDAPGAAAALRDEVAEDDVLHEWLGGGDRRRRLNRAVSRFVEGVEAQADYEELVRRGDEAKELL